MGGRVSLSSRTGSVGAKKLEEQNEVSDLLLEVNDTAADVLTPVATTINMKPVVGAGDIV